MPGRRLYLGLPHVLTAVGQECFWRDSAWRPCTYQVTESSFVGPPRELETFSCEWGAGEPFRVNKIVKPDRREPSSAALSMIWHQNCNTLWTVEWELDCTESQICLMLGP